MRRRIVFTGLGCISPLGNDTQTLWNNLIQGKSGVSLITQYDTSEHKCKIAAEVKDFDPAAMFGSREARRMDRVTEFALAATIQAVEHSGLHIDDSNRDRIGVVIGTGIGGLAHSTSKCRFLPSGAPAA